jgi:hypothetical protein
LLCFFYVCCFVCCFAGFLLECACQQGASFDGGEKIRGDCRAPFKFRARAMRAAAGILRRSRPPGKRARKNCSTWPRLAWPPGEAGRDHARGDQSGYTRLDTERETSEDAAGRRQRRRGTGETHARV